MVGAVVMASLLLGGVVACASPTGSTPPEASLITVPTQPPEPAGTPRPCMASLTEGVLVADARWGFALTDPAGGRVREVIWPYGYAARNDGGRLTLIDTTGAVIAHAGDRLRIGGGETGPDHAWLACGGITVVAAG